MAKGSAFADGKGKIDPDHYFDILEQEEIIGSKENDVKDNGDGTYDVTTNEGYIFEITLVPSAENPEDLEIEYVGKGDVTGPRITSFTSTGKTTNSISVAVEGRNLDGAEYTYSYKKSSEGEETWTEYETSENNTCTISGLETGVVYDIKVVVTTSEGTAEKELSEITGELKEGSITIGNIVWQGDGTAKVTVTTDITEPGCYIEYKIGADGDTWTRIASGDEVTLQLNDEVYVRVTDGTNVLKDAYRKIEDATNPIISKVETSNVTSNSITVTVTAEDNESGLATSGTYKYYLNNGEAITSTENSYTFEGLEAETMYTIKVEVFDKAGNKADDDSTTVSTISQTVESSKGEQFETTTEVTDASGDTVWIPGGFQIASDSANDADDGIVITDGTNEFVWIPVGNDDLKEMYIEELGTKLTGVSTTTNIYSNLRVRETDKSFYTPGIPNTTNIREPDVLSSYDTDSQYYQSILGYGSTKAMADAMVAEYKAIYDSIVKYDGFYIGRYELTGTVDNPTVQKGQTVLTGQNWYNLKKACTNVVSTNYAQTTMIYGNQWDEIMDWLVDTGEKTSFQVNIDSSSWGNYGSSLKQTGDNNNWKANNIFDLAGNCREWTQESYNNSVRILRGRRVL